ncbi:MAG: hypothetical protein ACEY3K_07715 [Wolbachia sp.]
MKSLHKFVVNHHCLRCYATKPSQCRSTGMTGEGNAGMKIEDLIPYIN